MEDHGWLLQTAWDVIGREGDRVTMDQIATAAGITRPILYRYFGDIGGLYLAVGERLAAALLEAFEDLPLHDGQLFLRAIVDRYTEVRRTMRPN